MEELYSEELEELLKELEEEYGADEPLAPEVEQYLRDLQPENFFVKRKKAVEELGRLGTSHPRVVKSLIAARNHDANYVVRTVAAESLQAAVHQEILRQRPDLAELAAAEVTVGPRPGRRIGGEPRGDEDEVPPPRGSGCAIDVLLFLAELIVGFLSH